LRPKKKVVRKSYGMIDKKKVDKMFDSPIEAGFFLFLRDNEVFDSYNDDIISNFAIHLAELSGKEQLHPLTDLELLDLLADSMID